LNIAAAAPFSAEPAYAASFHFRGRFHYQYYEVFSAIFSPYYFLSAAESLRVFATRRLIFLRYYADFVISSFIFRQPAALFSFSDNIEYCH